MLNARRTEFQKLSTQLLTLEKQAENLQQAEEDVKCLPYMIAVKKEDAENKKQQMKAAEGKPSFQDKILDYYACVGEVEDLEKK